MSSVGWGYDVHRFGGLGPLLLAGVIIDPDRGLVGTSDADVVAHAVSDALLGAAALGDLGQLFPSSDPQWSGANSMMLLEDVVGRFTATGWGVAHLDVTVIAERVRITPHRALMREALAGALRVDIDHVSVKATTTDGLGFIGRDEGVAAVAVVTAVALP
ncbi:MAG: 2-C-methyl-D-erythritol 2,4-cyclodiphosphate synthase [Acidimicrobiia bacterium]|nr:2-C-methyl-D-erythritol 2,4-cyclodiphosphate synthase [Acidimicrobiia bacterium]